MAIRVVRLGSPRVPGEGLRIGTVRRPPRGVPKAQAAASDRDWAAFKKRYRAEMGQPERARLLDLLVALSRQADFSVGCYCEDEARCHRSVLRELLAERGAVIG